MKHGRLLFLGYDEKHTSIIDAARKKGWLAEHTEGRSSDLSEFDLVVSFGYRHILNAETLATARRPVLNLHISYLPFNRGAHPNFWSFYENTPSGVTIHEIDAGIDTGPIVFQKYVNFTEKENTFSATYKRLVAEIESLFIENLDRILSGEYRAFPQRGKGTYHSSSDLPQTIQDWDVNIHDTLAVLVRPNEDRLRKDLDLIDKIQSARTKNNVNWMDLLRIAMTNSPTETKAVLGRINTEDNTISELLRKLSET